VQAAEVLVFAAASLKPALDTIIATPEAKAIGEIKASYAASSQLARQIEHGAPAAMFISADQDWMDYVEQRDLIAKDTRTNLLGNALVLIAPANSGVKLAIAPGVDLLAALGSDGRLAIGEPNSVPAGKYAKAALTTLGLWSTIEARTVSADNVRAALNFVARKEAPLGIVYRSDAISEPAVRIVDTFPASTHAAIVYPIALLKSGDTEAARRLLDLLRSDAARATFVHYGFDASAR
jgi:molybdate transport system substrate-binding protein